MSFGRNNYVACVFPENRCVIHVLRKSDTKDHIGYRSPLGVIELKKSNDRVEGVGQTELTESDLTESEGSDDRVKIR